MGLEIVRRIRGNVHDSIDVTELEDKVIGHPYFQRLRRIKQLAFLHYVFPGATHTRFEHSLGVMHLAGIAWHKIQDNQKRLLHAFGSVDQFEVLEKKTDQQAISHGLLTPTLRLLDDVFKSDYILQVVRLAGLLHDMGHPPFSHSGERFLPCLGEVLEKNDWLPAYLRDYLESQLADNGDASVGHEVFSMLLIDRVLNEVYQQYPDLKMQVDPRDVIAVMSTGIVPSSSSSLSKNRIYKLFRELITGELDIDRMDYLLRDSRECGVVYGVFDAGRILDSLALYFDPVDEGFHAAINVSALPAFEDYLRARHSMYLQLYFHKTSMAAEAMLQHLAKMLGGWSLPANIDAFAALDEYNIGASLQDYASSFADRQKAAEFSELVRDLIYDRRLWKRIFEVTGRNQAVLSRKGLNLAIRFLEENLFTFGLISSENSLTRFRPRGKNERSQNYLRLVKKDARNFPRVYPIEDHSSIISNNDSIMIHRVYVAPQAGAAAALRLDELRSALANLVVT